MKILVTEKLSEHKYKTPEGYLVCVDAILARTGKQTYRKNEVFATDDTSEIEVDRTPEEVFSKTTLASFENKPITVEHPDEDVNASNHRELAVGFVRDVHQGTFEGKPVMLGTLVITDAQTIEEIENGEHTDLSCGYDCDIEDADNPQQRNIRGNHVALCQCGRAGIARIIDSIHDDRLEKGKTYTAKSGAKLKVLDLECSFSDYDGSATIVVHYEFESASGKRKGKGKANSTDFWKMLTDKSMTADSIQDNLELPEDEDSEFLYRDAYGSEISVTNWDGRNQFLVVHKGVEKQMSRQDVEYYLDRQGARFVRVLRDSIHDAIYEVCYIDDGEVCIKLFAKNEDDAVKVFRRRYGGYHIKHIRKVKDSMNDEIIQYSDQLKFKKQYCTSRHIPQDSFYFDGIYAVDGKTDMNIPNAKLNLDRAALEAALDKHFRISSHDSMNDAKQTFNITYLDTYTKAKGYPKDMWRFIANIQADTLKEALQKLADKVALGGIGTANVLVVSIHSDKASYMISGKLSELIRRSDLMDSISDEIVDFSKQLAFKRSYIKSRKIKEDAFYFDGNQAVDGKTDRNIVGARLGIDRLELEAALDKHFRISSHDSMNDAKYRVGFVEPGRYDDEPGLDISVDVEATSEKEAIELAKKFAQRKGYRFAWGFKIATSKAQRHYNSVNDADEELDIEDCDYSNVEDACRAEDAITPVYETGHDKIVYVMQSNVDKNLYFYIGQTYSMKEGEWTYQKYKMNGMTADELKKELEAAGWHKVTRGPQSIIDSKKALMIVKAIKKKKVIDVSRLSLSVGKKISKEEEQLIDYTLRSAGITDYAMHDRDNEIVFWGFGDNVNKAKAALLKLNPHVHIKTERNYHSVTYGSRYIVITK